MKPEGPPATVTYNNAIEAYVLACCPPPPRETPTGLWWIVSTHVLPRMRLLHNFAADVAYYARRMVRTGFSQ